MIVEPDFLEHWKTRLLVRLLGTEEAPLHVIRLWAHCQHRKTDRFTGWEPDVLASVCRWAGPAQTLWDSMLKTGFARIEDGVFIAHGWADCNASLVSAWANGKLGGRPKKAKENEDSERNKKPDGNRSVIPSGTGGLSDREEKIEKRREDNALGDTNPLDVGGAGGETVAQPPQDKPAAEAKARKPAPPFVEPKREELDLHAAKIGLPPREVDKFVAYHSARGWMLGSRKMKSWPQAMVTWKLNWEERNGQHGHTGSGSRRPLTASEQRNATLGDGDLERIQANSDRRARELAEWMAANPDRTPFDGDR